MFSGLVSIHHTCTGYAITTDKKLAYFPGLRKEEKNNLLKIHLLFIGFLKKNKKKKQ